MSEDFGRIYLCLACWVSGHKHNDLQQCVLQQDTFGATQAGDSHDTTANSKKFFEMIAAHIRLHLCEDGQEPQAQLCTLHAFELRLCGAHASLCHSDAHHSNAMHGNFSTAVDGKMQALLDRSFKGERWLTLKQLQQSSNYLITVLQASRTHC
jgi:hypothetical protein